MEVHVIGSQVDLTQTNHPEFWREDFGGNICLELELFVESVVLLCILLRTLCLKKVVVVPLLAVCSWSQSLTLTCSKLRDQSLQSSSHNLFITKKCDFSLRMLQYKPQSRCEHRVELLLHPKHEGTGARFLYMYWLSSMPILHLLDFFACSRGG